MVKKVRSYTEARKTLILANNFNARWKRDFLDTLARGPDIMKSEYGKPKIMFS